MYRDDGNACDLMGSVVVARGVTVSLIAVALASAIHVASPAAADETEAGGEFLWHVQMGSQPSAPSTEYETAPPEPLSRDTEPRHSPEAYSNDGDELEDDYPAGSGRGCPFRHRSLELIV